MDSSNGILEECSIERSDSKDKKKTILKSPSSPSGGNRRGGQERKDEYLGGKNYNRVRNEKAIHVKVSALRQHVAAKERKKFNSRKHRESRGQS